jgi:rhodanese-related sulfurtransferase
MSRIFFVFMFSLLFVGCSEAQSAKSGVVNKVVSPAQFKELMKNKDVQIIDVRTKQEYSEGNISGAKNIDFFDANFEKNINQLDKNKKTLIYCKSGGRSAKAAAILKSNGFKTVYDLDGGYSSWPYK